MVNINGFITPNDEATIALENRGLNYGDGIFETLRFANGKIYFWEDHYFRLMASMRILRMEIPMNFTMEFLEREVLRTISASSDSKGSWRVKLIVWRVAGGKYAPLSNDIEYAISFEHLGTASYILDESDCEIELFKDHYLQASLLSTLKTTNKLIYVLGSIYAAENEYHNCLLLNDRKHVVEALNGNLFLVSGTTVKTPPLVDGCHNGIMRKQILAIIKSLNEYTLNETSITPFELQQADELFITNTIQGIVSVSKYRKKKYRNEVARKLLPLVSIKAQKS